MVMQGRPLLSSWLLLWRLCPKRSERDGVESLPEAQRTLARIEDDAGKLAFGKVLRKPLQVLEVAIAERRPGLNLDSERHLGELGLCGKLVYRDELRGMGDERQ